MNHISRELPSADAYLDIHLSVKVITLLALSDNKTILFLFIPCYNYISYKQRNHFFLWGCNYTLFLAMLTRESIGFGARESEVATCILTHLYLSVPELLTLKKLWEMVSLNFVSNIQAKVVNKNCCSHSKIISLPSSLQVAWWTQNPMLFFKRNYICLSWTFPCRVCIIVVCTNVHNTQWK